MAHGAVLGVLVVVVQVVPLVPDDGPQLAVRGRRAAIRVQRLAESRDDSAIPCGGD